jgi:hypothetical protein
MGRKNASDFAMPVLERMACIASEYPPECLRGISPEDLADAVPFVKCGLIKVGDCEGLAEDVVVI